MDNMKNIVGGSSTSCSSSSSSWDLDLGNILDHQNPFHDLLLPPPCSSSSSTTTTTTVVDPSSSILIQAAANPIPGFSTITADDQLAAPLQELEEEEEGEDDHEQGGCGGEEALGAMKEMMYRIAAMQPVEIDPSTIKKPRRRNVRISDDPQSVAARHRRERISERIRILQRLVPGGTKMDTASMLEEAIRYVKFLKRQVQELQHSSPFPPPPPPPATIVSAAAYNGTGLGFDHHQEYMHG